MKQNTFFSNPRISFCYILFFTISIFILSSCKKDPIELDMSLLTDDERLGLIIDTLPVELYTVEANAVFARNLMNSPLGVVNDELFGTSYADCITDFSYVFDHEYRYKYRRDTDSIKVLDLELRIISSDYYIDSSKIDFDVFRLLSGVPVEYSSSDYKINENDFDPVPLNSSPPKIVREEVISVRDTTQIYYYSVMLSNEFAEDLLDPHLIEQDSIYVWDTLTSNDRFKEHFKGFYLRSKDNGIKGGIINMTHARSYLLLRTKEIIGDVNDSIVSYMYHLADTNVDYYYKEKYYSRSGNSLNLYGYKYSDQVESVINDTLEAQEEVYIQSLFGPRVLVKLPALQTLKDSLDNVISVNKAELCLPATLDTSELKIAPNLLGLNDFENSALIDTYFNYFGGELNGITSNDCQYRFNIVNHIHYFLNDISKTDEKMFLYPAQYIPVNTMVDNRTTPGRIVLNGAASEKKPFLRLIYTLTD